MALHPSGPSEFMIVRSAFNLQTQQKRIRHLRSIAIRSLHLGSHMREHCFHVQCYFTLHKDLNSKAFYTSEKITGSTNPSWQSFDISRYEDQIDLRSKYFVLRVWGGQATTFRLLIEVEVHLTGLHFLAERLPQSLVKHAPNTVIFGMLDKYFTYINKEQSLDRNFAKKLYKFEQTNDTEKIADVDLPSSLLPAAVRVDQSNVRISYNTSSLLRIQTVLRAIKQMQAHAKKYRHQIEDKLLASLENSKRLEEHENLQVRVGQLRQELMWRASQLHAFQERCQGVKETNASRNQILANKKEQIIEDWRGFNEDKKEYIAERERLLKESALLGVRRRQMLNELGNYIYFITPDDQKYFINGIPLPHAEDYHGHDETMLSVGLGFSCHLTLKIAQVLDLPLRHPMENRGSRSVVYDQVHPKLSDKEREFPLYKSKDKYHFNYGVFLLNKNISQLRFHCNLPTRDLRTTLVNLLSLLHHLGVRMEPDLLQTQTVKSLQDGASNNSVQGSVTSSNMSSILQQDGTVLPSALRLSVVTANSSNVSIPLSESQNTGLSSLSDMFVLDRDVHAQKTIQQQDCDADRNGESHTISRTDSTIVNNVSFESAVTFRENHDSTSMLDEMENIFKPPEDDNFFKTDAFLAFSDAQDLVKEQLLPTDKNAVMCEQETCSELVDELTPRTFRLIRASNIPESQDGLGNIASVCIDTGKEETDAKTNSYHGNIAEDHISECVQTRYFLGDSPQDSCAHDSHHLSDLNQTLFNENGER